MEGRAYITILVALLVALLCSHLAKGFTTEKCKHYDLQSQLKQMAKCADKSNHKYLNEMSKLYREQMAKKQQQLDSARFCPATQQALEDEIICLEKLVRTCFDDKMIMLFSEFFSIFPNDCNVQNTPSLVDQMKMKEFIEKSKKIIGHYPDNVKYLMSIITFDKHCTYQSRTESFAGTFRCSMEQAQPLIVTVQQARYSRPKSFPVCNAAERILGTCFQANQCFSQQEMDLIRQSISTVYTMVMESLLQMTQTFGNYSNFVNVLSSSEPDTHVKNQLLSSFGGNNQVIFDQLKNQQEAYMEMVVEMADLAIKDYKTGNCKANIKGFSFLSSASLQLLPKWINIALIVLSVMLVRPLNLSW